MSLSEPEQKTVLSNMAKQGIGVSKTQSVTCCQYCPNCVTDIENPVKMKLDSGLEIQFCNEEEMNLWKAKYNQ